jgi:hypothetical protein
LVADGGSDKAETGDQADGRNDHPQAAFCSHANPDDGDARSDYGKEQPPTGVREVDAEERRLACPVGNVHEVIARCREPSESRDGGYCDTGSITGEQNSNQADQGSHSGDPAVTV